MGNTTRFEILYSESVTLFGRVVHVHGEEPVTGISTTGRTRSEVAEKIAEMVGAYLSEKASKDEREI